MALQIRRGTEAQRAVLTGVAGELLYTTDTKKLYVGDGVTAGGTEAGAEQTGAEIKSLYEAEANAFNDTKNTKLDGIETGATGDQTGAEIKSLYEAEPNAFTDTKNTKLDGIETGATAGGAAVATQADQEAGTDIVKSVTPGRQKFHPSAAKVWVHFNPIGNPIAIVSDYGATSITDHGAGDYTINFETNFSAVGSYCVVTGCGGSGNSNGTVFRENEHNASRLVGSVRMELEDHGGTKRDLSIVHAAIYGDQ